jgi:hypothetical protein
MIEAGADLYAPMNNHRTILVRLVGREQRQLVSVTEPALNRFIVYHLYSRRKVPS